jgi:Xaa-Pro aminopeptidase
LHLKIDTMAPVQQLRALLVHKRLTALIVPRTDEFLGQDIRARDEQLAWLSGFTGSAGFAVVTRENALIVTDSRYTDQARLQVDPVRFDVMDVAEAPTIDAWLAERLGPSARIGFLPALHTIADAAQWTMRLKPLGAELVAVAADPFDTVWPDRPAKTCAPVISYGTTLSGRTSADKRAEIAAALRQTGAHSAVFTTRESNAWLFNIRGSDLTYTPVADAISILLADGSASLFLHAEAVTPQLNNHVGADVLIRSLSALGRALSTHAADEPIILLDPDSCPVQTRDTLASAGARILLGSDPCLLPKARKNATEIELSRQAHRLDGLALVRFFRWLEITLERREVTELDAEAALLGFRSSAQAFAGPSFPTISAAGPNAAITHYSATPAISRVIGADLPYLVDSGGQYSGATTDVTRTLAFGPLSSVIRSEFTAVARGHVALAQARFPVGTTGGELDFLARQHLRRMGLDYGHSTGHGVGAYLNVHEGPQKIRRGDNVTLEEGMIVSNEPGYYKLGSHGMRLENLMVVRRCIKDTSRAALLEFETLTMAPIDRRMLDVTQLAPDDIAWIDRYHATIAATLLPDLDDTDSAWLVEATRPLTEASLFEAGFPPT